MVSQSSFVDPPGGANLDKWCKYLEAALYIYMSLEVLPALETATAPEGAVCRSLLRVSYYLVKVPVQVGSIMYSLGSPEVTVTS